MPWSRCVAAADSVPARSCGEAETARAARRLAAGVAAVGSLILAACGSRPATEPGSAVVERTVDGDTLVVRIDGAPETVRLLGIDTPETVDPNRPAECHGAEASARLAELLPSGTPVRLERDVEARDRYGRLLAHVHRAADGLFVNLTLVEEGFAEALVIPPNDSHRAPIAAAEAAARAAGAGRWSACPHE